MAPLLFRRLIYGLVTMWVVSALIFAVTELLPGDVAEAVLGQAATPEAVAAIRDSLGLDRPAYVRYLDWLSGLLSGDLGESLATGRRVSDLLEDRLTNTLRLAALTAVVTVPLGLVFGVMAAMFRDSIFDRVVATATLCIISVPEFFVAALLVMLFAVKLGWLPAIAYVSEGQSPLEVLRSLALPVATLTAAVLAPLVRMTRAAVLNVLGAPFIETALLKGATRGRIIFRHALSNAIAPIANVVGLNLAYLIGGVFIVETVFSYPGVGKLMVDSVSSRDIPLVQACAMIFCAAYIGLNLVADLLSIVANPRLRIR